MRRRRLAGRAVDGLEASQKFVVLLFLLVMNLLQFLHNLLEFLLLNLEHKFIRECIN